MADATDMKQRKQDKQLRIYKAALKIFARFGYRKTTVEDIANELGMTKGNLYLYIKSKQDLYNRAVAHAFSRWQEKMFADIAQETDVVRQLIYLFQKGHQYLNEDPHLKNILVNDPDIIAFTPREDRFAAINQKTRDLLKEILQRGVEQKRFRSLDMEKISTLFYFGFVMFINKAYVKSEGDPTIKMFEEGIPLILNGLLAPESS